MKTLGRLRAWAYERKFLPTVELPAFVVSVGNISLGGTGKSAFVMELAERMAKLRVPFAVLSRGYKRKSKSLVVLGPGAPLPDAAEIGDEPWMIKHRVPAAALLVHADRARKAARHWKELGEPKLVILDDAFQHWRCARNLDVLMLDATESLEQGTLPFGRLRETVQAARRADLIVITRAHAVPGAQLARIEARILFAAEPREQPIWKRSLRTKPLVVAADYELSGFLDARSGLAAEPPQDREYLLVSGIAKPDHLRAVARSTKLKIAEELYFPDHHRLSEGDRSTIRRALERMPNGALLVTEKDWGRWQELFSEHPGWVIQVRFSFLGQGAESIDQFFEEIGRCST